MRRVAHLFLACKFLCSPLDILFSLLIFILSKEEKATSFQVAVMASVKPLTALTAYYVTSLIFNKPQKIRYYLVFNTVFGCVLCLLFPFVQNIWFYIFSYGMFMTCMRASYPAWIELLKLNLKEDLFTRTISRGISIHYLMMIFLPSLVGYWMDLHEGAWKYAFIIFTALSVASIFLMLALDVQINTQTGEVTQKQALFDPLKKGWYLLVENRAFACYQLLFCLGGVGIVTSQSIVPIFFTENLNFSYSELTLAFSLCKGVAFVLSSPYWTRISRQISIYLLNSYVDLFSCLFFLLLSVSIFWKGWVFAAYLLYGCMMAGCEISWNTSGPYFSKEKESTIFSSINLAIIGIRGCICPFLGHLLLSYTSSIIAFQFAGAMCFGALLYGIWLNNRYRTYALS